MMIILNMIKDSNSRKARGIRDRKKCDSLNVDCYNCMQVWYVWSVLVIIISFLREIYTKFSKAQNNKGQ